MTQDNAGNKRKPPKLISSAPPPITPVAGRSSYVPESSQVTPKTSIRWRFWLNMREVKLWEACLLSLGIDPKYIEQDRGGWMAGGSGHPPFFEVDSFPSREVYEEYHDRVTLLRSNLGDHKFFSPGMLNLGNPNMHGVRLDEFAAWGLHVGFSDMPTELVAVAQRRSEGPAQSFTVPKSDKPQPRQRHQEDEILRVIGKLGYTAKALPKRKTGKSGVKGQVRKELNFSTSIFNKAWERLRNHHDIQDAE